MHTLVGLPSAGPLPGSRVARKSVRDFQYRLFAHRLRRARLDAGLTQVEVAEALGRPQSLVSNAETGERRLDVVELLELLQLYGVGIAEFVRPTLTAEERRLRAEFDAAATGR